MLAAMRVRTILLLLLLLVAAAFVLGWREVLRVEREKFESIARSREVAWRQTVEEFLRHRSEGLENAVKRFSQEEGLSQALLENKTDWAGENLDERMLGSFDVNVVWVFRRDGSAFFTEANTRAEALAILPVTDVRPWMESRRPAHFFFSLENADGKKRHYVEVRGLPVHESWDQDRTQPAKGIIFFGRIWDEERLRELRLFAGAGTADVQLAGEDVPRPASVSDMVFWEEWRDWLGRPLARLVIANQDASLASLEARGDRLFVWLLVGGLMLGVLLYLLLNRAIVRPLRMVIQSMHSENLALLEPVRKQKAEFGELARLIHEFFHQRTDLMREIRERNAAEKALRDSEEMLRHSQKMEAVGRLAGGVAHDFNNLLTAIIGYAELLRQRFAHDPVARQPADLIHQAGEQAAGLTRQLLAFSRKQLLQPKIIDLNRIVTNLHRLLQRIIGEHIEIRTQTDATSPCVKADPGQIEQVIVNLGVNARDAMPRGGHLTIRTRNITLTDEALSSELVPGNYVALEVTDTGEGMDAETRARIFEPFFTTKGPGKGTGLGLATVYGIVRQSHGGIVVESERGRGSTFRILLPREDGPVEVAEAAPILMPHGAGAERILVVEDEEIVRELVCEILRGHGYEVLATDRGTEAVRLVKEVRGKIDLLISDVVMPEMNGADVARCVNELAPSARVLFVSGYSENDMADQGLEALAFQVLQKPFTPATLARKVREVLDGPGPEDGAG